jgi:hypothetical protein
VYGGVALAFAALAAIAIPAYGLLDTLVNSLTSSAQEPLQARGSTLMWRFQTARELLQQWIGGGPLVHLFGKPFGSGYERYLEDLGHVTNYSPHNFYVEALLRVGLLGVGMTGISYGYSMWRLWSMRGPTKDYGILSPELMISLQVANLVYFGAYGASTIQGVFLGVSMGMCHLQTAVRTRHVGITEVSHV